MRRLLRTTAWAALVLSAAAAPPVAAQVWGGERALVLRRGSALELHLDGRAIPLDLPAAVDVERVVPLGSAAWVAGTRRDATGREIYLARVEAGRLREIAPPAPRSGRLRAEPLPFGAGGELAGLVWLEGDGPQQLAVRVAMRDGDGWETPQEIAPPGPGSQLALAAASLADGSTLLIWSRFDGRDDEIVFSRRVAGSWSAPQPIAEDNGVPDITPTLVAGDPGALAAWSRYDGREYRVVTSIFDGTRWSAPREVGGPGTLEPAFAVLGSATYLLYLRATPRSWELADVGPGGEVTRRARFARESAARPVVVVATPDGRPGLRWADAMKPAIWEP